MGKEKLKNNVQTEIKRKEEKLCVHFHAHTHTHTERDSHMYTCTHLYKYIRIFEEMLISFGMLNTSI